MKGSSLEKCVAKAQRYIDKNGLCLLLFDVEDSRCYPARDDLQDKLRFMMKDINERFSDYFPMNDLAVYGRYEKGFCFLLGDGSWAGIDDYTAISEILKYQREKFENIKLYWDVAENGYDEEGTRLVK